MSAAATVHASAVLLGETGILVRGAPGRGKSTLVLAILDAAPGRAWLIADDRVALAAAHGRLVASVPATIAGLIEVRGQGLVRCAFVSPALIRLVVDLVPPGDAPRLPEPAEAETSVAGVVLPRLALPSGTADGGLRVRLAAGRLGLKLAELRHS